MRLMTSQMFATSAVLTATHGFFTRHGGVSSGVYDSLQCGFGARDDAADNVAENRRRAIAALGAEGATPITARQTHSAHCVVAEPWERDAAPEADAVASDQPGLALGVLAADCAPVLLEDRVAGVAAAAHAGWRGALDGVLEATLDRMTALGARRDRIGAAIGPCIGPARYQVGPEFHDRFVAATPENASFFQPDEGDRHRFDLPGYAAARLRAAGVREVDWIGRCTYDDPDFFSHRRAVHRDEPDYGRLISIIMVPTPTPSP